MQWAARDLDIQTGLWILDRRNGMIVPEICPVFWDGSGSHNLWMIRHDNAKVATM